MINSLRLQYWNIYFVVALGLHYLGSIQFSVGLNVLLASLLLLPVPTRFAALRHVVAAIFAIALLYHESWWPPIGQYIYKLDNMTDFGWTYTGELFARAINPYKLAAIAALAIFALFIVRRRNITKLVLGAILLPLLPLSASTLTTERSQPEPMMDSQFEETLNGKLEHFFQTEAIRKVVFDPVRRDSAPYDILVLHVCSLAWSDLEFIKKQNNELFQRFDILFSNVNTVTTYSGPAMIRLMRSSCGQARHDDMYGPPSDDCLTFNLLETSGFEINFAMNHDGRYGDFLADIRRLGGFSTPLHNQAGVEPYLKSFDETPIARDIDVLSQWWDARISAESPRVALYYNSITLHDGNRYRTGIHSDKNSMTTYSQRAITLLNDINNFIDQIEKSERNAILVVFPEHGAAIRGDKRQMAGLRELPSPNITRVPVGVKLIGAAKMQFKDGPVIIEQPASYLAVAQLLANFVRQNPFNDKPVTVNDYTANLPRTEFVSDNASIFIMRRENAYYIRSHDEPWTFYDPS